MTSTQDFRHAMYDASKYSHQRPVEYGSESYIQDYPARDYAPMTYQSAPGSSHSLTALITIVILGVIVYLAVKKPQELAKLFNTYMYGVVAIVALLLLFFLFQC